MSPALRLFHADTSGRSAGCCAIPAQDARWLALLVDTEGSICVNIGRDRPMGRSPVHGMVVGVSNCDLGLLEVAQRLACGGHIRVCPDPPISAAIAGNHKVYRLGFASRTAFNLLVNLYPWFIVKKKQAKVAMYLEHLKHSRKVSRGRLTESELVERENLCSILKSLNKRVDVDVSWIPDPLVDGHLA